MLNPAHVLEIALLLLVAFLVGASLGTLLRFLALSLRRPVAVAPPVVDTVDPFALPALVTAPVIDPLPQPARPVEPSTPAPEQVPVPDFAAAMLALATEAPPETIPSAPRQIAPLPEIRGMPAMPPLSAVAEPKAEIRPARTAGEATSGRHVGEPKPRPASAALAPTELAPSPASAEVIPFPIVVAEPVATQPVAETPERPADEAVTIGGAAVFAVTDAEMQPSSAAEAAERPVVAETPAVATPPGAPHDDSFTEPPAADLQLDTPIAATIAAAVATADLAASARPEVASASPEPVAAGEPSPAPYHVPAAILADPAPAAPQVDAPRIEAAPPAAAEPPAAPELAAASLPEPVSAATVENLSGSEPAAEQVPVLEPQAAAVPLPPVSPDTSEDDEAAAMRAIEGSWTPRRTATRVARSADPPESIAESVVASGAAVAAAARVIEAVVADAAAERTATEAPSPQSELLPEPAAEAVSLEAAVPSTPEPAPPDPPEPGVPAELEPAESAEPEPGRPVGLAGARHGVKDDLTHIIGVLPVIETALNSLGLFHFDQVAELGDDNVDWLETHLGIAGRIRRELWREQARELDLAVRPKAAAGS